MNSSHRAVDFVIRSFTEMLDAVLDGFEGMLRAPSNCYVHVFAGLAIERGEDHLELD